MWSQRHRRHAANQVKLLVVPLRPYLSLFMWRVSENIALVLAEVVTDDVRGKKCSQNPFGEVQSCQEVVQVWMLKYCSSLWETSLQGRHQRMTRLMADIGVIIHINMAESCPGWSVLALIRRMESSMSRSAAKLLLNFGCSTSFAFGHTKKLMWVSPRVYLE